MASPNIYDSEEDVITTVDFARPLRSLIGVGKEDMSELFFRSKWISVSFTCRLLLLFLAWTMCDYSFFFFFLQRKGKKVLRASGNVSAWGRRDAMSRLAAFGHNHNRASSNSARRCMHRVQNKVAERIIWTSARYLSNRRKKMVDKEWKGIQGAKVPKRGRVWFAFLAFHYCRFIFSFIISYCIWQRGGTEPNYRR